MREEIGGAVCSETCIAFGVANLAEDEVSGKSVLEVGALVCRGTHLTLRPLVESMRPSRYTGVDIEGGPGVDELCNAEELRTRFGDESFDVVISTEMLEHVRDWRAVVSNLKHVLRPGGTLLVTTRSRGFPYHSWPDDHWRYELEDMAVIFGDLEIDVLEPDPADPGVFMKATRPTAFAEADLSGYKLYSIKKRRRALTVTATDERLFHFAYMPVRLLRRALPQPVKALLKTTVLTARRRALRRALRKRGESAPASG